MKAQWSAPVVTAMVVAALLASAGAGGERNAATLLREGTVLAGVDGTLVADDVNDLWRFELGEDVNDVGVSVAAGTRFTLLPSAVLEALIADVNDRQAARYKLSATVTRYRGRNFLFASRFLPLSKLRSSEETADEPNAPADDRAVGPPADAPALALAIPPEVLAKLQSRQAASVVKTRADADEDTPRRPPLGT